MDVNSKPSFKFPALFLDSLTFYIANLPIFFGILVLPAVTIAAASIAAISLILGFSVNGSEMDPNALQLSLTPSQWLVVGVGVLAGAIALSLGMAASVHATANRGTGGVLPAFARIGSKSMQIFWMQCVIYALALRFSPWTVLLFWLVVASVVPVALCEDLGPSDAMDRAWSLSRGHRFAILATEIVLLVPPVLAILLYAILARPDGPLYQVSPLIRAGSSWLMMLVLLAPVQFMFVAMTRVYQALASEQESVVHARAASNVNS